MKRKIIDISEDRCDGCGLCVPNCPEGAIRVIDGKARLVGDMFCDGLGACIGNCPRQAILIEERDAGEYDEKKVMENIVKQGNNTVKAHLEHLLSHGESGYFKEATDYLESIGMEVPVLGAHPEIHTGCPGSKIMNLERKKSGSDDAGFKPESELSQWPVQLQLINPDAGYFDDADLLVAADCVAFAYADFHRKFLKNRKLVVFCPKLDKTLDSYVDKLAAIFSKHRIKSVAIVHMEVPCCSGTSFIVEKALEKSGKNIILKEYTVSLNGELI
jgi:Pyruvate/2-oxoacid:ferredoxin oxidoreductase delta subunit